MRPFLRRYVEFVVAHPRTVLLASLFVSTILASGAARLSVDTDPENVVPANNHYIGLDRKIRKEAGFTINIPSDFYQLRLLGGFVPATMIVSCLTSLSLLPALVLVLRPRFIFGRPRVRPRARSGSD